MTFVCLTDTAGKEVWINLDHIICIQFDADLQCTWLYEVGDGSSWRIRGRPEDIERKVAQALFVKKGFRT